MKKHINLVTVVMLVIALASLVAAAKPVHSAKGGGSTYGFSSGG